MLCSDLLWDAQSVSRKQVPTLQDAFLCCDRETLLSMVEQGYARHLPGWGQSTPQQRRVARKRMGRALDAMLDCVVKRKSGKALCIFPEERFVVHARRGQASIERLVQARVADLSAGAVRQGVSEGGRLFGCVPWSQGLSYRVWLEGPWDCCERYMVLASAFWHLTHRLIGQKVCPEHLFTPLRTGTLSRDAIRPRQAPLPISAERRPRLP